MRSRISQRVSRQQVDLGSVIVACFQQACSEGRLEVAEHLLVAIEQLSKDSLGTNDPERDVHLAEAYRVISDRALRPLPKPDGEASRRKHS